MDTIHCFKDPDDSRSLLTLVNDPMEFCSAGGLTSKLTLVGAPAESCSNEGLTSKLTLLGDEDSKTLKRDHPEEGFTSETTPPSVTNGSFNLFAFKTYILQNTTFSVGMNKTKYKISTSGFFERTTVIRKSDMTEGAYLF